MDTKTFKIKRNCYGRSLYTKNTVTFNTGLTVLVGCNGCGKTTMIGQICDQLEREGIEFIHFDNLTNGGYFARELAGFTGDLDFLAQSICSSEGENIMLNIVQTTREIAHYAKKMKDTNQDELWILMDAIDSGFSVDNVVELKEQLVNTVLTDQKNKKDVYFLISANEYELARGENCLDTPHCKYITFDSYEDYRSYVMSTRERKNKQLEKQTKK